jgi:Protein of unknown function (DUF4079)
VRAAAYLHPVAMIAILALGMFVLREGLRIRRGRLLRRPVPNRRHRRLARWLIWLALAGFGAGLASMVWLRGKPAFGSVHFWLAAGALSGMWMGAQLGFQLEKDGRAPIRGLHALLGTAGLLLGLAAAVAGFAILP